MSDYHRLREQAGLADLQQWTRFELSGPEAGDALDGIVGCNVRDLFEGRTANTLIPSPTGGVEAIVWIITLETGFRIIGEPTDEAAIRNALDEGIRGRDAILRNVRDEQFALALIGPEAERIAAQVFGDEIYSIAFMNAFPVGDPVILATRIGYLGEYELHLFGAIAEKQTVLDTLKRAGGGDALMVGEAAFPTMMIEMRTLNRSRDVPPNISVFEAGLQWMIDFHKEHLRAATALEQKKNAIECKCVFMVIDGGAEHLPGQSVFVEEHDIGHIQSACFSVTLGKAVALAYLIADLAVPGLSCTVGADRLSGKTASAPAFLSRSVLNSFH